MRIKCPRCEAEIDLINLGVHMDIHTLAAANLAAPSVPDWVAGFLNRRTDIEHQLRLCAAGKRGPIEAAEALDLANRLAVPDEFMGRQQPTPWEVAEQIAAAIEPKTSPRPYSIVASKRQALHWAASVARSLFPRPV
ncbi:hypothetical protein [Devosia ginsengisoli]|uniref:hypothetical protein n=1 Tax=Devosia ginsengisoli TaxID=400770 RepID=UPI0026F1BFE6|nr:hypothetical protein [Devosia ginsengisoli]MCR6673266.1 hypothetical protein [Devosia ginsengisoli]